LGLTLGIRSQPAVAEIMAWQKDRGADCEAEFTTKYGASPWPLATVLQRMKSGKMVFVVAKLLKLGREVNVYLSCKALPKCCKKGFLIAIGKRKISFVDPATLVPVDVAIKRYRGATQFWEAMGNADMDDR
jgi:hypothetical protein